MAAIDEDRRRGTQKHGLTGLARTGVLALTALGMGGMAAHVTTAAAAAPESAPVRIAILSTGPAALPAVDLLTAEFSGNPNVQLLERAEMDKVLREQGVSAAGSDCLKLGQMLGADGLLLLSPAAEDTNRFLQARLVAVGPGVVIGAVRGAWPIADMPVWSKGLARHFGPLLPKLSVPAKEATPISVVNVRAAIRSAEEQELERQLTVLVAERLARERELFVLERQRMDLLSAEKELRGSNEAPFWSGSHLLEAVLDRDGYAKETLTLNARLLPPKGGAPVVLEVSGSRTNLSEVLNRLAGKVREGLKLGSRSAPWEPADEAAQFLSEARWAFKWGMLGEAQSACEASWALGNQTKEVAELRIRAYGAAGAPGHSPWFAAYPTSPDYAPDIAMLRPAMHALELYEQGFRSFLANEPRPDTNWYGLGIDLLRSELLRQFNYFPGSCRGHEQEMATLRLLSRNTVALLENHPLYTNLAPPLLSVRLGAYWYETPEQGLLEYRRLADSEYLHTNRLVFAHPVINGWTPADKARVPAVWRGFIDELCNSTNPLKRVEGYFLNFADAEPRQAPERARTLFKVAVENAPALVAATYKTESKDNPLFRWISLKESLLSDINEIIAAHPKAFLGMETAWTIRQSFDTFRVDFERACGSAIRDSRLIAMTNYLAQVLSTNRPIDYYEFGNLFVRNARYPAQEPHYRPDEAKVLIPLLRDLQQFLREPARQKQPRNGVVLLDVGNVLDQLESLVAPPGSRPPPMTNLIGNRVATIVPGTNTQPELSRQVTRQIPPLGRVAKRSLQVTPFWQWPPNLAKGFMMFPTAGPACLRDGRVWTQVAYQSENLHLTNAFLLGFDPVTFTTQTIELPLFNDKLVASPTDIQDLFKAGEFFEVSADNVFYNLHNTLKRYSLSRRTWEELAAPTAGRLCVLDGRLYATTDDSVVEIPADGNSQRLLASTRRRPPLTILDSLDAYHRPPLFHAPDGALATLIQGKIYALDEKTRAWSELTILPGAPASVPNRPAAPHRALLYQPASGGTNLLFIPLDQEAAVFATPRPACLAGTNWSIRQCRTEDPLWPERQFSAKPTWIYLEKNKVWLRFSHQRLERKPGGALVLRGWREGDETSGLAFLFAYWKELGSPLAIPLELDLGKTTFGDEIRRIFGSGEFSFGGLCVQAIPTSAGIVLINNWLGLWVIPWNDLESAVQAAREERSAQQAARTAAINGLWTNLSQKYQVTQKDSLTDQQKEAMMGEPAFIELNLDNIDANHNGMLEAAELSYFDPNHNGMLDPPEEAALEAALSLLAQRLMDEYDLDQDGQINRPEFDRIVREVISRRPGSMPPRLYASDLNKDGFLSGVELQFLLKQEFLNELRPVTGVAGYLTPPLKFVVDRYWARTMGRADGRSLRGASPDSARSFQRPGRRAENSSLQHSATP